jgi:hypothetical protein
MAVLDDALTILENCPENCDRSCYRCLRSYKNKFEHALLDRQIGASLLRFTLGHGLPTLAPERLESSTTLLFQDISRQGISAFAVSRDVTIVVPGLGEVHAPILIAKSDGTRCVVALSGPLTPEEPADSRLRELKELAVGTQLELVDELVVRRNLPRATSSLLDRLR